mgnify:CR=1 FL=1
MRTGGRCRYRAPAVARRRGRTPAITHQRPNGRGTEPHGGIQHHHRRRFGAQPGVRSFDLPGDERDDPPGCGEPHRRPHRGHHRARAHVLLAHGVLQPLGRHVRRAVRTPAREAARRGRGRPLSAQDRADTRVLRRRVRPRPGQRGRARRAHPAGGRGHPHRARLPH